MKNPETSSSGTPADAQGNEPNPADILTEVPGANTASAEILTEVSETPTEDAKTETVTEETSETPDNTVESEITETTTEEASEAPTEQPPAVVPLGNETADDRTPGDKISPKADASVNVFEQNPDDSTDITAEFDDEKAQEIEKELEEQEPTNTLFGIGLDGVEIRDTKSEFTPSKEDYESFSSYYFASLCDQLDNPNADQTEIYESIAVLPSLINLLSEVDPSDPTSVFEHITQTYLDLAEKAREEGQKDAAEKQEYYAVAARKMGTHFDDYLRKLPHMPAEKHSDSETPVALDPNNPLGSGPWIE